MSVIDNLEPKIVWEEFEAITKIPRCSKHEEQIREHLINFAKEHNLEYDTDKPGNVVIRRPASHGMENKPIVVLQSHMDMVCEKNSDIQHDFSKDPIKLKIEGDNLTADGTTLGADNGIGVAVTLALLKAKDIKVGPLEGLFTVDEETGLTGAFALEPHMLNGKIMLNIDSEDFGVLTVGCAGGGDSQILLPLQQESVPSGMNVLDLKLAGLRGGHSGVDVHEQRGNATKIITRLIWKLMAQQEVCLIDIKGGDKHNAIPREAFATIAVKDTASAETLLKDEAGKILDEIKPIDPKMTLAIKEGKADTCLSKDSATKLINLLHTLPHGVEKMSYDIEGLVETSTNLATVSIKEDGAHIGLSSRSSISSALQDLRDRIKAAATLAGATVAEDTPYPGWKPNLESNILKFSKKVFKDMFNKEPVVEAIHAGLECGVIGEKFEGMDMISIGPTIRYPHSPEELVEIPTVPKFWEYTVKILESLE